MSATNGHTPNLGAMELKDALNAQLRYTSAITESAAEHGYSDDGFDDLRAALDVCSTLATLDLETGQGVNEEAYAQYMTSADLDNVPEPLNLYSDHIAAMYWGTDGIAPEIHDAFDQFHKED